MNIQVQPLDVEDVKEIKVASSVEVKSEKGASHDLE
jgi:hypothetical protein